ncbi:MAG TPA: DNA primase [Caulobacteraceae bacterium]|nr:DNA primase [Caulobacteraceae bacterium]
MRFDDAFLDELKSRLRLSDVIGRTVKLRRQGREYVGLSPFTKEKSPSFFVNDDKGFFHDFSSSKHGDLITFLQETERLSFVEAVERLAAEAGMALPAPDPRAAEAEKKSAGLIDWLETAAAWFEAELRRPAGRAARDYLSRRGLPESDWKRFRLGFAPGGRTALKDYLVAKGAQPVALVDAGLLISPEDGGAPYDRFRDRIMFPIVDGRGRVVSFGGRALDPQARAKYLNGPETPVFHKGRVLYGLPEARRLLHASGEGADLVVVEGYMDVIACQRAGVAAVAPMGTALTEEQMETLWRLHPEPTLCFDSDRAGRAAAFRAIDRALPLLKAPRSFKFALSLGDKDPDDVLREHGAAALKARLADTTAFVDLLFARERDAEPLDTPERRAGLRQRLRKAASAIADPDLAQAYRDELQRRLEALFPSPAADASGGFRRGFRGPDPRATDAGRAAAKRLAQDVEPMAAALARYALADPAALDPFLDELQAHGFGDPALGDLVSEIIRLRLEAEHLDTGALERHLRSRGFSALLNDIDRAAAKSGAPFIRLDVTLAAARSQWTHAFSAVNRLAALQDAMDQAKQALAAGVGADGFIALKTERDSLRRALKSGTIFNEDGSN